MYTEQVSESQLEEFYNLNQIICKNEDGSEFPMKYRIHCAGKFYNFDGEKFGYTMFLKDYSVSIGWLQGPIKQQIVKNWQNYLKSIIPEYENALNEHNQAKAFKTENNTTL